VVVEVVSATAVALEAAAVGTAVAVEEPPQALQAVEVVAQATPTLRYALLTQQLSAEVQEQHKLVLSK
jgi:hypothetical protein